MKKIITLIVILISIWGLFLLYNKLAFLDVLVKFDDLEPIEKQMNVYFKGFKIGRTTKIYPDEDYVNTYIRLKIKPRNINLPDNVTAQIKRGKGGNYITLLSPDSPNLKRIKDNDVIVGIITKDLNTILAGENLETLVEGTTNVIENANNAIRNLNDIFLEVKEVVQNSKQDIKTVTSNLAKTSTSLTKLAQNVEDSVDKETISSSLENIEMITKNLNETTMQIDKVSVPIVNSILCETNSTMRNANEISSGVKKTLKKHGGFGRFLFGRPISKDCY